MKANTKDENVAAGLLLEGGTVVDVATGRMLDADVLIKNGRIEQIG